MSACSISVQPSRTVLSTPRWRRPKLRATQSGKCLPSTPNIWPACSGICTPRRDNRKPSIRSIACHGDAAPAASWSGYGLEDFDGALGSGSPGELLVAGEQGGVHGFREGYEGRVVDGEVVPQFPAAGEQGAVRCPPGPSSARATTRTLASATITVVADRGSRLRRPGAAPIRRIGRPRGRGPPPGGARPRLGSAGPAGIPGETGERHG